MGRPRDREDVFRPPAVVVDRPVRGTPMAGLAGRTGPQEVEMTPEARLAAWKAFCEEPQRSRPGATAADVRTFVAALAIVVAGTAALVGVVGATLFR